jgi:hypothetical protein
VAAPALLAGWRADGVLTMLVTNPEADPGVSEFRARAGLLWRTFTGRW